MRLSTTRPRERGTRLRVATYASHIPQSDRSVTFLVLPLFRFGLLMLVSIAIVMLNMGGPSTV
jgi:hypothetical protein